MVSKLEPHENILLALAAAMIVCLALAIVAFPVALIWISQPIGTAAATTADAFAIGFSLAFFAAFVLAMVAQSSCQGPLKTRVNDPQPTCRVVRSPVSL